MIEEAFRASSVCVPNGKGHGLEQLSFSLYKGEILGMCGNRYAGKNRLFSVMAGETKPVSGLVIWNGSAQGGSPVIIRVSENSVLIDSMQVWENLALLWYTSAMLKILNSSRMKAMVRLLLEDYGIRIDGMNQASALTPMQKVMLEILVARHKKVQILILDISGVEGTTREYEELKSLLIRMKQEGISVLVFSHYVTMLSFLADRIAILHEGRILKIFSGEEMSKLDLHSLVGMLYLKESKPEKASSVYGEAILSINHLDVGLKHPVSFTLHRGEFVTMISPQPEAFHRIVHHLLQAEQTKECPVVFKGSPFRSVRRDQGIVFLNTIYLDQLIEKMSPLENLCMGICDKAHCHGIRRQNLMRCLEQDFYEWYGHEGMLRQKDCSKLYRQDRIAINLFRIRFLSPSVIFSSDLSIHNDIITYHLVKEALAEFASSGIAVCMITGDMTYNDELTEHRVVHISSCQEG